jgi:hypothetical protein
MWNATKGFEGDRERGFEQGERMVLSRENGGE